MDCDAKILNRLSINRILSMMRSRGYIIYKEPYRLNIVGERNANTNPNRFDDEMYVIWKDDNNNWQGRRYVITTDPSTKYLLDGGIGIFDGKKSTAILPHGQYVNSFKIGLHKGKYTALTQDKEICVYRDYDRDSSLTFNIENKNCGFFGINIHRAKSGGADDGKGNTKIIGDYSAGCQVFKNYYCFQEFMGMAKRHKDLYGNSFTYTLFDISLRRKFLIKRTLYTTAVLSAIALIGYGFYLRKK